MAEYTAQLFGDSLPPDLLVEKTFEWDGGEGLCSPDLHWGPLDPENPPPSCTVRGINIKGEGLDLDMVFRAPRKIERGDTLTVPPLRASQT